MANDDDALLQKAKMYDRQALTAIYDAFYEPLYRYIYRQVDTEETARDLTAEVFHRFLQAEWEYSTFRHQGAPYPRVQRPCWPLPGTWGTIRSRRSCQAREGPHE